jgi:hypothetical protein
MESVKLAASVGHVYGKQIVGAESFTADEGSGRWLEEPFNMKAVGDRAFTIGLNRVIFHRYAMQPWLDVKPGMTMGPWGTHLDRTQTWWTEAKEWLRYLSRCQYLLQQGKFVADVCYFYGEGAPVDLPARQNLKPAMPDGYDYDGADVQALMSMQVVNGRLQLPSGMSYRLLVLPQSTFMTSRVAAKIRDLVAAGATVLGPKPLNTPSLSDFAEGQEKLDNVANQVWGTGQQGPHTYQKGRVFVGLGVDQVLQAMHVSPDFQPLGTPKNLLYIHRRIGADDVYFVSNQNYRPTSAAVAFRVGNRTPELWHPDSGTTEFASSYRTSNGNTTLDLTLGPAESVFVVFRRPAASSHFSSVQVSDSSGSMKSPKLEILKAFYGSFDGRGRDVTKEVQSMVADGQTAIAANNASFGDPVLNVVKQLTIDYRLNVKELRIQVPENAEAVLLPMPRVTAPRYEIKGLSNGNVEAVLWRPSVIKFATVGSAGQGFRSSRSPLQLDLSQNWKVQFAPNLGAPKEATFAKLISWPEHASPGIRYFSGSATYSKAFTLPSTWNRSQSAVRLDLGTVKNFATVTLNGKSLPPLWKPPFVADVTNLVHPGLNRLSIKITNLWANRLIGDEQLPAEADFNGNHMDRWPTWLKPGKAKIAADRPKIGRITFATWKYFDKNSPLQPSGLLGPVRLESAPVILLKPR